MWIDISCDVKVLDRVVNFGVHLLSLLEPFQDDDEMRINTVNSLLFFAGADFLAFSADPLFLHGDHIFLLENVETVVKCELGIFGELSNVLDLLFGLVH